MTQNSVEMALDPSLLKLKEDEVHFFKSVTGIQDDEELKGHIIRVQAKAYAVYPYPCIQLFTFTKLTITHLFAYNRVLELSRTHPGAILLDVGCCFGSDLRKAVLDGWPVENVIGCDIIPAFWDYGHELFGSTPESFPAAFVPGNLFESTFVEPREPFYAAPSSPRPTNLQSLSSLIPLQGHVSAMHVAFVFHLFDEEHQLAFAKKLASLLSPEPGSTIFGIHGGGLTKGFSVGVDNAHGATMFCHSEESWKDLWDGQVFNKGCVKVEAKLVKPEYVVPAAGQTNVPHMPHWLIWSVTRL